MSRPPTTTRWIITAVLAAWLPLCFCQAAGVVRMGLGLAGLTPTSDSCCSCCHEGNNQSPSTATSRVSCCTVSIKIAPRSDRWTPDQDSAGTPLAAAVAHAVIAHSTPHPRTTHHRDPAPIAASRTLLRQHCALVI